MRTAASYSGLQIALHWTIAALVIFQLLVNDGMQAAWRAYSRGGEAGDTLGWAWLHVAVGVSILLLALLRVYVRLTRGVPPIHRDKPAALVWLAYATHLLLYGFIIVMPLTGALAWFGGIDASAEIHETGKLVLIPLVLLHAAGALAEHFYFRNDAFARMLKPQERTIAE
jgi:cytochrome b561